MVLLNLTTLDRAVQLRHEVKVVGKWRIIRLLYQVETATTTSFQA